MIVSELTRIRFKMLGGGPLISRRLAKEVQHRTQAVENFLSNFLVVFVTQLAKKMFALNKCL